MQENIKLQKALALLEERWRARQSGTDAEHALALLKGRVVRAWPFHNEAAGLGVALRNAEISLHRARAQAERRAEEDAARMAALAAAAAPEIQFELDLARSWAHLTAFAVQGVQERWRPGLLRSIRILEGILQATEIRSLHPEGSREYERETRALRRAAERVVASARNLHGEDFARRLRTRLRVQTV